MDKIRLRPAESKDLPILWKTRNDPQTRKFSLSKDYIPFEQYKRWFEMAVTTGFYALFIIEETDSRPIGQIRLAFNAEGSAEISIALLPNKRGKGYGTMALLQGMEIAYRQFQLQKLYAVIKPENLPSRKAFLKAGFKEQGNLYLEGTACIKFIHTPSGVSQIRLKSEPNIFFKRLV